jgi:hypothetical protein
MASEEKRARKEHPPKCIDCSLDMLEGMVLWYSIGCHIMINLPFRFE